MSNLVAILFVTAAALALGAWRARGLLRREPALTVDTVHRRLPEAVALLALCLLGTTFASLAMKYPRLGWRLPVAADVWLPTLLWFCTGGIFGYLAVITVRLASATRHAKRARLALATTALLAALVYINVRCSWPAYRELDPRVGGSGFVRQSTEASCAAASCANVLRLLGVPASEREMGWRAGTTAHGTRSGPMVRALRAKGVRCRKRDLSVPELVQLAHPAILLVEFDGLGADSHAVVFRPRGEGPPALIDPLNGAPEPLETNSLAACWRGRLIECAKLSDGT